MWRRLVYWTGGVRLYIGLAAFIITLEAWWWADASYAGSILFATRLEEFYAWMAVGLIGLAVAIGPFYSVLKGFPGQALMRDARRWIGISAAWFASLHVLIAYLSLFKAANPATLPGAYQRAFLFGAVALLILLAMAFTSFDRAQRGMGIWWFRLHRFIYLAAVLALLHAFMVGAHATDRSVLVVLAAAAAFILGLHVVVAVRRRKQPAIWQVLAISAALLALIAVFGYGYAQLHRSSIADKGTHQS